MNGKNANFKFYTNMVNNMQTTMFIRNIISILYYDFVKKIIYSIEI